MEPIRGERPLVLPLLFCAHFGFRPCAMPCPLAVPCLFSQKREGAVTPLGFPCHFGWQSVPSPLLLRAVDGQATLEPLEGGRKTQGEAALRHGAIEGFTMHGASH